LVCRLLVLLRGHLCDCQSTLCVYVGGTLKIYGETICPEVPYKTLLLTMSDTVAQVVRETLDKYGLENEDAHRYCLMQVTRRLCNLSRSVPADTVHCLECFV